MNKLLDKNWWLYLLDVLLKRPNIDGGFIDYEPVGTDEVHDRGKTEVLGNAKTVLLANGDYRPYRPTGESQKRRGNETMSCVSQSACNALEEIVLTLNWLVETNQATEEQQEIVMVFKHFGLLYKDEKGAWNCDIADRPIAKLSNTTRRGNTQKNVADAIRHYGLVKESDWPWVDGWNNYYAAVPQEIIDRGKAILEYIEINYEWSNPVIAKDALQYAPLQTSVYAWPVPKNGVYPRVERTRNHATIRDAYSVPHWHIFDSYEPYEKRTSENFNFGWDMLFTLHLKKKLSTSNSTWDMTNVKILQSEKPYNNGAYQVSFLLPQMNEEAMISIAKNFGMELPRTDKGELDWPKVKIDGTYKLNEQHG